MAEIRQKVIKCPQCGSYYDSMKHQACPYCQANAGNFNKTIDPNYESVTEELNASSGGSNDAFTPTEDPFSFSNYNSGGGTFTATQDPYAPNNNYSSSETISPDGPINDSMGHTIIGGFSNTGINGIMKVAPVVGWLVVTKGPLCGTDFRLRPAYNLIGRESGDIIIKGDGMISRANDSAIVYDPRIGFQLEHRAGRNILLLNGGFVSGPMPLHSFDKITIGKTELVFVALCGDRFEWPMENKDE